MTEQEAPALAETIKARMAGIHASVRTDGVDETGIRYAVRADDPVSGSLVMDRCLSGGVTPSARLQNRT